MAMWLVLNWINLSGTGECKHLISNYLKCLKINKGVNEGDCRLMAKDYLGCRMEKYV